MGIRSTHVVWGMYPRPVLLADARFDSCGMHMGIRMNYMGMRMSGASISMAEWATSRRGASMQVLSCKA